MRRSTSVHLLKHLPSVKPLRQVSGASLSCDACPYGEYQDEIGSISCKRCGFGVYQNATGQSSCIPCPVGTTTLGFLGPKSQARHIRSYVSGGQTVSTIESCGDMNRNCAVHEVSCAVHQRLWMQSRHHQHSSCSLQQHVAEELSEFGSIALHYTR